MLSVMRLWKNLRLSGFGICRVHAINLGRLIWSLAYEKAHKPQKFWEAAPNTVRKDHIDVGYTKEKHC